MKNQMTDETKIRTHSGATNIDIEMTCEDGN